MLAVDTHQHLWSPHLWEVLARRQTAPFARRGANGWTLHLPAEPACSMPGPEPLGGRAALLDADLVDLAIVAPSTALATDWLDPEDAEEILSAHRAGIQDAGSRFRRWGSISLVDPDPRQLIAELADGAVGLCVPAGAVQSAASLERLGPVLEQLARSGAPLFIHPGPAPADLFQCAGDRWNTEPWWWPGLTDYVASMQRSWLTWASRGRREHPELRVVFAMLAGLAPMQAERLAARGATTLAEAAVADQLTWYETSSYGPIANGAMSAVVGSGRLVHGSDRPVVEGALPVAITRSHATDNVHALLRKAA